jgi:lysophospholipase L1-like esterase
MSAHRTRRRLSWDDLEDRRCPAPFVGPPPYVPPSVIPVQRTNPESVALQDLYVQQAKAWSPQVAFFGDSITYNFGFYYGQQAWTRTIAPLDAQDYGEPGDTTQNILWRIENGEFPAHPKVVVVEAGSNNLGTDGESPQDTLVGIENLVNEIHYLSPTSTILLVGMIPVGDPTNRFRPEIVQINAQLARFANNQYSFFLNISPSLLAPDQTLTAVDEPDLLHPNALGYQIWANDMIGMLDKLLGIIPAPSPPPPFVGPQPFRA